VGAPAAGDTGLPRWEGELRSAARANLLVGVTSTRIGLKAACARAERLLERYAEPLAALHGEEWPAAFLDLAWGLVVDSSGHDSVTGCGVDATALDVASRLRQATQVAEGLRDRVLARLAGRLAPGSVCVLNPSPFRRQGLVELDLAVPDGWESVTLTGPDGRQWPIQERSRAAGPVNAEVLRDAPLRRLSALVEVPALGWAGFQPGPGADTGWAGSRPGPGADAGSHGAPAWAEGLEPVRAGPGHVANGLVDVTVAADGSLRVESKGEVAEGVGRLVDGGDAGDTYNYAPPYDDETVAEPESVSVELGDAGPLCGELAVTRTYRWPAALDPGGRERSGQRVPVTVAMAVSVRAGEPFARIALSFDNPCRDHRLRIHLPLCRRAASSSAEGQFAVVERGGPVEEGHGEVGLATHPARGFVDAGGLAVLLDHVTEHELLDGTELALTVLRATGQISRDTNRYRRVPAGPEAPAPGAQCLGPAALTFAVHPHPGSWVEAGVVHQAELYQHGLVAAVGRRPPDGGGAPDVPGAPEAPGAAAGEGLSITGAGVALSSLRRRGDWLELRVVAEHPAASVAEIAGGIREARATDLLGRPGEPLALDGGVLRLRLGPWEIATVQLRRAPGRLAFPGSARAGRPRPRPLP
ncbi:MAG: alpha-mannosidase, partial [Acidimicrobiales bacterium]